MNERLSYLDKAIAEARKLPPAQQEALAAEIMARVDEFSQTSLSVEQLAEIKARLADPPSYADGAAVADFFARHGVKP